MNISVALCTYNGSAYLQEQVASLAQQTRIPDELVLCDDGSSDDTVALAREFAATAPFPVRLVQNEKNLGYSRNFAQAIGLCSGEIIALCDQDDLWYPDKLRRLEDLFSANRDIDGIFSNGDLMDSESTLIPGTLWESFCFRATEQKRFVSGEALQELVRRNTVTGMAFAIRSSCRHQLAECPASWPHDAWLGLMLAKENRLLACPNKLVTYRVHAAQEIGTPATAQEKRQVLKQFGVSAYREAARIRNRREYLREATQFEELLQGDPGRDAPADRKLLALAQGKARYARRGLRLLSMGPLRRLPLILRFWRDYKRYSHNGFKSLLRDLIL